MTRPKGLGDIHQNARSVASAIIKWRPNERSERYDLKLPVYWSMSLTGYPIGTVYRGGLCLSGYL